MSQTLIIWTVIALGLIFGSCTYSFKEPPFTESDLVDFSQTIFAEEFLASVKDLPETDETSAIKELDEEARVLEVSEDFLIAQEFDDDEGAWELMILTKNRHHMMVCSLLLQDDLESDIQFPSNVEVYEEEGKTWLLGDKDVIGEFALELSLNSHKFCLALPYQDASQLGPEEPSVIVEVPVATEVIVEKEVVKIVEKPVEVIVEKEVIKEVIVEKPVEAIAEKEIIKEIIEASKVFSVEKESGGTCNNITSVSNKTGAANTLMLFGPLLAIACYKKSRKRNRNLL